MAHGVVTDLFANNSVCRVPSLPMGRKPYNRTSGYRSYSVTPILGHSRNTDLGHTSNIMSGGLLSPSGDINAGGIQTLNSINAPSAIHLNGLSLRGATRRSRRPIRRWRYSSASLYSRRPSAGLNSSGVSYSRNPADGTKMEAITVSLIGASISLVTFIYTVISSSRKANSDRVTQLEQHLHNVEDRLAQCEEDRHDLRIEIYNMREEFKTANGHS